MIRPGSCRERPAQRGALSTWAGALVLALSGCATRDAREASPPKPAAAPVRPFGRLSQYALFAGDPKAQQPADGVIPYELNSALFSDYAEKYRFVKLPQGTHATYSREGPFVFPVGTIIAKTFAFPHDARDPSRGRRLIETRILKHEPEGWVGLPYVWNKDQTEATLDVAGDMVDVSWIHTDGRPRTNNYIIPNANQCKGCHKSGENMVPIGPKARHLNRDYPYRDGTENQLAHWSRAGILAGALPESIGRALVGGMGQALERHARRPRPGLAGNQLRPLPQSGRPGAQLGPRPFGIAAQSDCLWHRQAADRSRNRLGRPGI